MDLTGIVILIGLFLYFKTLLQHTDNTGKILVYGSIIFFLMTITLTACQLMSSGMIPYHIKPLSFDPTNVIKKHVNVQDFVPKYLPEFNPYSPQQDNENIYPALRPLKYL